MMHERSYQEQQLLLAKPLRGTTCCACDLGACTFTEETTGASSSKMTMNTNQLDILELQFHFSFLGANMVHAKQNPAYKRVRGVKVKTLTSFVLLADCYDIPVCVGQIMRKVKLVGGQSGKSSNDTLHCVRTSAESE